MTTGEQKMNASPNFYYQHGNLSYFITICTASATFYGSLRVKDAISKRRISIINVGLLYLTSNRGKSDCRRRWLAPPHHPIIPSPVDRSRPTGRYSCNRSLASVLPWASHCTNSQAINVQLIRATTRKNWLGLLQSRFRSGWSNGLGIWRPIDLMWTQWKHDVPI